MLDRVPLDKLAWKPHERSLSLGDLAWHVATIPARIASLVQQGTFEIAASGPRRVPDDTTSFGDELTKSLEAAKSALSAMDDEAVMATFRVMRGETVLASMPKAGFIRSIMLNHSYHHRGQLSVYLRLLDVPVPSVYGASADENPFA